jgi:hypothetical protein
MTDTELSKTIQEISISPEWLNKHYNAEPSEPLVISELHTIVSDIFKETKK